MAAAAAAAKCGDGEYTSARDSGWATESFGVLRCSLKFIVSGEKLIKHRARALLKMRMTKGYFHSHGRSLTTDVITWIVIGGSNTMNIHARYATLE